MERKKYVIVVAGGRGVRMGTEIPKQFLLLGGIPILQRTITAFVEAIPGIEVITVLPKDQFAAWKDLCVKYSFTVPQKLVAGGISRFHSVKNGLAKVPAGAIVAIHDGVRPLVDKKFLRGLFSQVSDGNALTPDGRPLSRGIRALIPVLKVTDTLHNTAGPDPDRSTLLAAQTPQIFLSEDIKEAYRQPYDMKFTDDASVAAAKEIPLTFAEGERKNIKITTPEDIPFAEHLLLLR
ncbi:MAG: 2-C-methyl-D-erythritol 4-phosphate cytidylyltransferase [Bacteroidales bacterium]|nr:2-C-methyl-D-erythritol 4-phosphate cytidylyltransferase [Bacteroidales bacterium]